MVAKQRAKAEQLAKHSECHQKSPKKRTTNKEHEALFLVCADAPKTLAHLLLDPRLIEIMQ